MSTGRVAVRRGRAHPGGLGAAVNARALAALGDLPGARRAADVHTLAEQLNGPESADTWFGYPAQKHAVHLSQAYTLLGRNPRRLPGAGRCLGPHVFPVGDDPRPGGNGHRAACLRVDGDPAAAAAMASAVYDRLPAAYRSGLVPSRAQLLHRNLRGVPRRLLGDVLA
ncbi:hypothetical protein ACFWTC_34875 [Streptomyces sp. NPDC058619]|uniref:hypothetical protein n=1 Tax=unclassified Streptomyces TaxID=2593676 RepID=UPI00366995AF